MIDSRRIHCDSPSLSIGSRPPYRGPAYRLNEGGHVYSDLLVLWFQTHRQALRTWTKDQILFGQEKKEKFSNLCSSRVWVDPVFRSIVNASVPVIQERWTGSISLYTSLINQNVVPENHQLSSPHSQPLIHHACIRRPSRWSPQATIKWDARAVST